MSNLQKSQILSTWIKIKYRVLHILFSSDVNNNCYFIEYCKTILINLEKLNSIIQVENYNFILSKSEGFYWITFYFNL